MMYKLLNKQFGTRQITEIIKLDIEEKIKDFCFVKNVGYFVLTKKQLIAIDLNNQLVILPVEFNNASSICYDAYNNCCLICENNGADIYKLSLDPISIKLLIRGGALRSLHQFFKKAKVDKEGKTSIVTNEWGDVFWTSSLIHRCFTFYDNVVKVLLGNGRAGFSICSNIENSIINSPTGICCYKKAIYVADSNNHCVMRLSNDILTFIDGNPFSPNMESNPTKMKLQNLSLYYLDGGSVKHKVINSDFDFATTYRSDNIVSIDTDDENNLLIMEELKNAT